jgi:hypothetical protein
MESRNLYSKKSDDYDEEEEEEIDLSDKDWRAFRAQLVMSKGTENKDVETSSSVTDTTQEEDEPLIFEDDLDGIGALFSSPSTSTYSDAMSETNFTPLNPSQWAYDSGKVIEEGAVILGGVEQDYGFGLRQQYFHKAVILVLDHDEATFTKGIILNRPSDRVLKDDNGYKWRIWFGGDVQGLDTIVPDIICLHSIEGVPEVDEASIVVMKDIKVCWSTYLSPHFLLLHWYSRCLDRELLLMKPKNWSRRRKPSPLIFGYLQGMLDGVPGSSWESSIENHGICAPLTLKLYSKN